MNSILFLALAFVCFTRSATGVTYQIKDEECLLADQKKGVCRSFESCPTAALSLQKLNQPVGCQTKDDICCELSSGSTYEIETPVRNIKTADYNNFDEETYKFLSRLENNDYHGRRQPENYIKKTNNYYDNRPYNSGFDSYYNGNNNYRPQYWPNKVDENSFIFPNEYQNGNNYQESENFGNQRPITQRPKTSPYQNFWLHGRETSTFRPLLPTYKPDFNTYWPPSPEEGYRKRISERKCEEYFQQVVRVASGLPLILNPKPIRNNPQNCVGPQKLIVGGQNTTPGEFPHMAVLYFRSKNNKLEPKCGGSLISDRYVLTAAHCLEYSQPEKILLGGYDTDSIDAADSNFYSVAQSIFHPRRRLPIKYNDIVLIRLSERVKFSYKIRPACLYSKDSIPEQKVVAAGWGLTSLTGSWSNVLLKVTLNVYNNSICNKYYKSEANLPSQIIDSQICAGDFLANKDTCKGDSGGPIEIVGEENNCFHYIVGITSFGRSCGGKTPGIYTKVYSYLDWIESIVWPQ